MTDPFNLLTEPWIPCLFPDARRPKPLNLRETLSRAHEIREIYHDSPLTIAALHRLLLAILHRVFGPANRREWATLWNDGQGHWDERKLDQYFESDACRGRFNLFDPTHPFYQVAQFPESVNPIVHPMTQLTHEYVSGNNATLFDHSLDHLPEVLTTQEAILRLITAQAFYIGFGNSFKQDGKWVMFRDAPCARGAWLMVEGNNLFQTHLLSMREYPKANSRLPDLNDDLPAWEMDNPFADNRQVPNGYLDYLTWQSLRVRLVKENGQVIGVQRIQGLRLSKDDVLDPLKSYRFDNKGKPSARGFRETKALWRDSTALLELTEKNSPENFELLSRLVRLGTLNRQQAYNYLAFGLVTEAGNARKVTLWRYERMPLPLEYLDNPDTIGNLNRVLKMAEQAGCALENARDWFAWRWLEPDKYTGFYEWRKSKDYKECQKKKGGNIRFQIIRNSLSITRHYWWRLDEPFRRVFAYLAGDEEQANQALRDWQGEIRQAADIASDEVMQGIATNPRNMRALVEAQALLKYEMIKAIALDEGEQNED